MRGYHTLLVAFGLIAVLVVGAAGHVAAHEEQTVEGYELTFGGADEPIITDERMWLELEIVDGETGEPVEDQADTLEISVQNSGQEKEGFEVSEKHGEPGVYQVPVVFTEPGDYMVHVEGSIEGTEVHTHFEKEVHDAEQLEYPADESADDESADSCHDEAVDDSHDEADDDGHHAMAGFAPISGVGAVVAALGAVAIVGTVLPHRRR